jgi:hypothetical protein
MTNFELLEQSGLALQHDCDPIGVEATPMLQVIHPAL